jgi:hypothetical protein
MPSHTHQILIELFRRCPTLLAELLAAATASGPPLVLARGARVIPMSATFTGLSSAEFHVDLALHVLPPASDRPLRTVLIEAQLGRDRDKRFTWPLYSAAIRARDRCPVTTIVLALDRRTARWAARPIVLDPQGTHVFRPIVIGPGDIPQITSIEQARAIPELTMLSALVHCRTPGGEHLVRAALIAAGAALDRSFCMLYARVIGALLSEDVRRPLEALMHFQGSSVDAEIERYYRAQHEKSAREALSGLLIALLTQRFGTLPEAAMARIQAADSVLLMHWGERVLPAGSLDEVLDSKP